MTESDRERIAHKIRATLASEGYTYAGGQIIRPTGEVRMNFVLEGGETLFVALRDKAPGILAECCNAYEEIHAVGMGLIHSATRKLPLKYSEIATADLSPDIIADLKKEHHYYLGAFWGLRVLVAAGFLYKTGAWKMIPAFFGW